MVKNTKTWIFWERIIFFLRNKRILNLCLRWRIFRSYPLLAAVTFIDLFYTKFIYILSKFCPVQSFDHRWNNDLTMFLYKRNTCFILENLILFCFWATFVWTTIDKVILILSSQRRSNTDEHTLTHFSLSMCSNN